MVEALEMTKKPIRKRVLHRGNSVISAEEPSDYPYPVVVKWPGSAQVSRQIIQSLERGCQMGQVLAEIKGVRKARILQ